MSVNNFYLTNSNSTKIFANNLRSDGKSQVYTYHKIILIISM